MACHHRRPTEFNVRLVANSKRHLISRSETERLLMPRMFRKTRGGKSNAPGAFLNGIANNRAVARRLSEAFDSEDRAPAHQ
jgi:hypothetical protein